MARNCFVEMRVLLVAEFVSQFTVSQCSCTLLIMNWHTGTAATATQLSAFPRGPAHAQALPNRVPSFNLRCLRGTRYRTVRKICVLLFFCHRHGFLMMVRTRENHKSCVGPSFYDSTSTKTHLLGAFLLPNFVTAKERTDNEPSITVSCEWFLNKNSMMIHTYFWFVRHKKFARVVAVTIGTQCHIKSFAKS